MSLSSFKRIREETEPNLKVSDGKRGRKPKFPVQLLGAIEDKTCPAISFDDTGTKIMIHDWEKFFLTVLSKYFPAMNDVGAFGKNRATFLKQMNCYGFVSQFSKDNRSATFVHPLFQSNNRQACLLVPRNSGRIRVSTIEPKECKSSSQGIINPGNNHVNKKKRGRPRGNKKADGIIHTDDNVGSNIQLENSPATRQSSKECPNHKTTKGPPTKKSRSNMNHNTINTENVEPTLQIATNDDQQRKPAGGVNFEELYNRLSSLTDDKDTPMLSPTIHLSASSSCLHSPPCSLSRSLSADMIDVAHTLVSLSSNDSSAQNSTNVSRNGSPIKARSLNLSVLSSWSEELFTIADE